MFKVALTCLTFLLTSNVLLTPVLAIPTTIAGKRLDLTSYKNSSGYVTTIEAQAAFSYTGELGYAINGALREGNASSINKYAKIILNLASFVNKTAGKSCTFYRFINGNPALLGQMKTRGQTFVERGFFSATLDRFPDDEGHFSNKEYVIRGTSSRCSYISGYSRYQGENEVLFPPGTIFVVTKSMRGKNIYLRTM